MLELRIQIVDDTFQSFLVSAGRPLPLFILAVLFAELMVHEDASDRHCCRFGSWSSRKAVTHAGTK